MSVPVHPAAPDHALHRDGGQNGGAPEIAVSAVDTRAGAEGRGLTRAEKAPAPGGAPGAGSGQNSPWQACWTLPWPKDST